MPQAFLALLFFQLLGTCVQSVAHLSVPGPVIGMFLLAAVLIWRERQNSLAQRETLSDTPLSMLARSLIASLGLLFVPAGVGVVSQMPLIISNFIPIIVALVGSTLLGLLVSAFIMHRMATPAEVIPDNGGQVL
jgi:holin-like protein